MRKIISFTIFFVCCFWQTAYCQVSDSLDAYAVINKAIEAQGGKEYLQSIKTLYTNTKTSMNGIEVNWIVKEMLPNKGSFQIVNNNRVVYQSWFDGKNGYEIVNGKKKKQDAEENKDKAFKKNIISELDYIDTALWKINLVGQEKVMNELCYKIKATLANGLLKYLYYSKSSFLLLKDEKILNANSNDFFTFIFMAYKKAGQLTHYTELKFGDNGKLHDAKIIDWVINQSVEEKDFK